ncbi:phosphopyruvate hydratase [Candidatus Gottesmanbacteria bacterium]|nr:phosphopyruvate hydratase [Candidatus Gottesmanbacteria bacterium]
MSKITKVYAREILDSRGNPTIETAVYYQNGFATASVPSGSSTGKYEAVELRDNDPKRFMGMGVKTAVDNVNKILGPAIIGMDLEDQFAVDKKMIDMDGTENKSKLGANSILSISMAAAKAASYAQKIPPYLWFNKLFTTLGGKAKVIIPTPILNVINGGKHGTGNLDFQEFQIIPASIKNYPEGLKACTEVYHAIAKVLEYRNAIHAIGDEGGFAPNLYTNLDAMEVIIQAIKEAGYTLQKDIFLGLDIAPAFFYKSGRYQIKDVTEHYDADKFIDYIQKLHDSYHLLTLEDPLFEDEWDKWVKITKQLGSEVHIIGDDLLVTNQKKLQRAIDSKACNAILVKPNQIGSVLETLSVVKLAKDHSFKTVVSHRSGETDDYIIADFAVGVGSDFVKFGAPARGERVVKYNRLLTISYETQGVLL